MYWQLTQSQYAQALLQEQLQVQYLLVEVASIHIYGRVVLLVHQAVLLPHQEQTICRTTLRGYYHRQHGIEERLHLEDVVLLRQLFR